MLIQVWKVPSGFREKSGVFIGRVQKGQVPEGSRDICLEGSRMFWNVLEDAGMFWKMLECSGRI